MTGAATEILTADDALYEELYDVEREAVVSGNFIAEDPYPAMNALRGKAPIQNGLLRELMGLPPYQRNAALRGRPGYACLGFDVCMQAFRDNQNLSNASYHMSSTPEKTLGFLEMDDPEHQAYRAAVQVLFQQSRAQTWWREQWIDTLVDGLVANLQGKGRAELNMQLCARLPVHTITRAMGMRGDDALQFREALVHSMGNRGGPAAQVAALAKAERMLTDLVARRRAEPDDDPISWLIATEVDMPGEGPRPLTEPEMVVIAKLLLLAGGGTTWRQLGIVLFALMTHRDQFADVKADRSLIEAAVQESVRWNPTNPVFGRLAVADVELGGMLIPKGSAVEICLGAANRDPSRWENPDAYDLHRRSKPHLGFGFGSHMCLGRNVAASEMSAAINKLLDNFPNIRIDPDAPPPFITGGLEQRGVSALPVLLT